MEFTGNLMLQSVRRWGEGGGFWLRGAPGEGFLVQSGFKQLAAAAGRRACEGRVCAEEAEQDLATRGSRQMVGQISTRGFSFLSCDVSSGRWLLLRSSAGGLVCRGTAN